MTSSSWHNSSCEKSSTINTFHFTSPWPRLHIQAMSETLISVNLVWSEWNLHDLIVLLVLPLVTRQQLPYPAPALPSAPLLLVFHLLTHLWRLLLPSAPHPPASTSRKHGSRDAFAEREQQSFDDPPSSGRGGRPECVMHYLINTNAAVWPLQDDWLVLCRSFKLTLFQSVCTKTFRGTGRLHNPSVRSSGRRCIRRRNHWDPCCKAKMPVFPHCTVALSCQAS